MTWSGKAKFEVEIDDQEIIEYVVSNFSPEDIFPKRELEKWAEENGYTSNE